MLEARANPYSPPDNAKPPTARAIISQDWGVAPRAPQPVHGLSPPDEPGVLWLLSDPEIKVRRRENENVRDLAFSLSLSFKRQPPAVFILREATGRRMATFLSPRDN